MFVIDTDQTIHITRGDIGVIEVTAMKSETELYTFQVGDIVRIKVFTKKKPDDVVLRKDVRVDSESESVDIPLLKSDTTIGIIISKPIDYWYEIELNPETASQTIVGYDRNGPKLFRLYPEGGDET